MSILIDTRDQSILIQNQQLIAHFEEKECQNSFWLLILCKTIKFCFLPNADILDYGNDS